VEGRGIGRDSARLHRTEVDKTKMKRRHKNVLVAQIGWNGEATCEIGAGPVVHGDGGAEFGSGGRRKMGRATQKRRRG
jgi:hypothetical protein